MPDSTPFVTVRDPVDSLCQSTVEDVAARHAEKVGQSLRASVGGAAEGGGPIGPFDQFVAATNKAVYEAHRGDEGARVSPPMPADASPRRLATAPGILGHVEECASRFREWAEAFVNEATEKAEALGHEIDWFAGCNPFWLECVAEYKAHYEILGLTPSRPPVPEPLLPYKIPRNAVVAVFSDWGTGEPRAIELLNQIKIFNPDILMHMGDVYYSGTPREIQSRFLGPISAAFGDTLPRVFSLCGNHDMYSGGKGYYDLTGRIGQGGSYFAIQNDDWMFAAMDTGLNDRDPSKVDTAATFLDPSDVAWLNQTVAGAGSRKVVLFSHHPPFSAYEPIAGQPVNEQLLAQVQPSLPRVSAWFWGHEHRLGVYESYRGVERGRCLGHGAIPVPADDDGAAERVRFDEVPVHRENGSPLAMGVEGGLYKTGFAIMTLDGKDARVRYYREGESSPLWQESF